MFQDILYATKDGLMIAGEIAKKQIVSYKLNRKFNVQNVRNVQVPPKIKTSCYVNLSELSRRKFGDAISYFSRILELNFISNDLTYFYNNIKTLKIEDLRDKVNGNTLGSYFVGYNKIILYDDYLKSIYHELFHMASSCYRDGIYYSGFAQSGVHDVARGLNEGYTELLTRRYFGRVLEPVSGYEEEVRIAEFIEKVVGKTQMESCYLKANLIELLRELRKYLNNDEVVELISNIDKILFLNNKNYSVDKKDNRKYSIILYSECIRATYLTIFKAYARKLKMEINDKRLSKRMIDMRINDFLPEDDIIISLNDSRYSVARIEDFNEIFNDVMNENNMRNNRRM